MSRYCNIRACILALSAVTVAGQAQAGGYQINEQGVSGQGYGYAGRSSHIQDATIVFGNPAGMAFLNGPQLSLGGTYLDPSSRISNLDASRKIDSGLLQEPPQPPSGTQIAVGELPGSSQGDMVPASLVPSAFLVQPLNDRLTLGFGVYVPFGARSDYADDFKGRYFGDYTEVSVLSAQQSLSYRINPQWSVGGGLSFNNIDGELRRQLPTSSEFNAAEDIDSRVEGDDQAFGYHLGVIFRPDSMTTLGLAYRSSVDYNLEGRFNAFDPLGNVVRNDSATLDITTPDTLDLSVTRQVTPKLSLMAGASRVGWSDFQEIRIIGSDSDVLTLERQEYKDTWAYAVGSEYQMTPVLALRAGITLDPSPTNAEYRSVRIPTDDRRIYSLGAGWEVSERLVLDFAYSYLDEVTTSVDQERSDLLASEETGGQPVGGVSYAADYRNSAHILGTQLTYRF